MRSFGVRQLAAALARASLLAGNLGSVEVPASKLTGEESGSKLPHSKAGYARPNSGSARRLRVYESSQSTRFWKIRKPSCEYWVGSEARSG